MRSSGLLLRNRSGRCRMTRALTFAMGSHSLTVLVVPDMASLQTLILAMRHRSLPNTPRFAMGVGATWPRLATPCHALQINIRRLEKGREFVWEGQWRCTRCDILGATAAQEAVRGADFLQMAGFAWGRALTPALRWSGNGHRKAPCDGPR